MCFVRYNALRLPHFINKQNGMQTGITWPSWHTCVIRLLIINIAGMYLYYDSSTNECPSKLHNQKCSTPLSYLPSTLWTYRTRYHNSIANWPKIQSFTKRGPLPPFIPAFWNAGQLQPANESCYIMLRTAPQRSNVKTTSFRPETEFRLTVDRRQHMPRRKW